MIQLKLYYFILYFLIQIYAKHKNATFIEEKPLKPIKIAFCLTGQLARLELMTKIRNIFVPNINAGHEVHVIILLDNEIEKVKQTFWKFDYSNAPYYNYNHKMLQNKLIEKFKEYNIHDKIKSWIKLAPPIQSHYEIVNDMIPVSDKVVHKSADIDKSEYPKDGIEKASIRFQNNMRWLAGLRECMKFVQSLELKEKSFYDLVVRLRDDSYAFDEWILSYERYGMKLTSASTGSFRGVNDHNFVVDRLYADDLLRGLTEDYYFNSTLQDEFWGNPEHRIYQLATSYNIPLQNNTVCQQPLVPLRGKYDKKNWMIHSTYSNRLISECNHEVEIKNERNERIVCQCNEKWLHLLKDGIAPIEI